MMNTGRFPCPKCAGVFQVDATTASGQVRCPHCQEVVQVPSPPPASPTKPPPPPVSKRPSNRPLPAEELPGPSDGTDILPQAIDGTTGQQVGPLQALGGAKKSSGISLEEPVKTAGQGREAVELTHRPPEERAARRRRRNFWFWFFCLTIILGTLALLLNWP